MKTTNAFKMTILDYLETRAQFDELFRNNYQDEAKNIDDCITYILNQVKASGQNGFTDDEIYSMAVHYYDEKDIEIGKPIDCRVVVNHAVELTEEEKQEARKNALLQYQNEELRKMQNRNRPRTAVQSTELQPTLF